MTYNCLKSNGHQGAELRKDLSKPFWVVLITPPRIFTNDRSDVFPVITAGRSICAVIRCCVYFWRVNDLTSIQHLTDFHSDLYFPQKQTLKSPSPTILFLLYTQESYFFLEGFYLEPFQSALYPFLTGDLSRIWNLQFKVCYYWQQPYTLGAKTQEQHLHLKKASIQKGVFSH